MAFGSKLNQEILKAHTKKIKLTTPKLEEKIASLLEMKLLKI